jgi:hypothetical protein
MWVFFETMGNFEIRKFMSLSVGGVKADEKNQSNFKKNQSNLFDRLISFDREKKIDQILSIKIFGQIRKSIKISFKFQKSYFRICQN